MDAGHWGEAREVCQSLLAAHRLDPVLHFHMALVEEQLGHEAAAERFLRQALYLDRTYVLAHYHLGLLLRRRHDAAGARRCFQNALRLLAETASDRVLAEGLTAEAVRDLATMHLELL
jgi:chemotaxis protein methyltransferase CheR